MSRIFPYCLASLTAAYMLLHPAPALMHNPFERHGFGTGIISLAPRLAQASESPVSEDRLFAFFGRKSKKKSPLSKKERALARTVLSTLDRDAHLLLFSESEGCKKCGRAEGLFRELASMSPRLTLEVLSLRENPTRAGELGIDKVPGIAILDGGKRPAGIRYYGLPLGHEFEAFLGALVNTARGDPGLQPETVAGLARVTRPVVITVFVARH